MTIPAIFKRFGAALLLAGCASSTPPAATTPPAPGAASTTSAGQFGVLLMAHGGSPEWNAAVLEAVQPLRARYDIEVAFGMADATSLQDSVTKLEARNARKIGVVRLFVSGESFLAETEKIFGLRPGAPAAPAAAAAPAGGEHAGHAGHGGGEHAQHAGHAGGDHAKHAGHAGHAGGDHAKHAGHAGGGGHAAPAGHGGHSMAFHRVATQSEFAISMQGLAEAESMGTILADRAAALSKTPAQEDVLILAHGPGDDDENTRWLAKLDERAAVIRAKAPFRRVQVETLREDWPDKRVAAEARIRAFVKRATETGGRAIVIPFRVQGFGPYAKVLEGLDYVADRKGLIPHPEVTRWIESQIGALETATFRATLPQG